MELEPITYVIENTFRVETPKAFRIRILEERKNLGWFCPDCVQFFPKNWFNIFRTHEKLVIR